MAERLVITNLRTDYVDHDHDHWCLDCKLDTGIRVFVAVALNEKMHLQVHLWCVECKSTRIVASETPRHCG